MLLVYSKRIIIITFSVAVLLSISQRDAFGFKLFPKNEKARLAAIYKKKLDREIEKHIQEGRRYYLTQKYHIAIYEWGLALSLDPKNKRIREYIEEAKARLEKSERTKVPLISVLEPFKEPRRMLTLRDCIDMAVKNSLQLKVAEKQISLSEARLWEARRNFLPKATLQWEEYTGRIQGRDYYGRKQFVDIQQNIFKGGETLFTMKQAEINLEVTKNEYKKTKNDIVLQAKKSYYALAKAKENLKVQAALKEEMDGILDMVKRGFDLGVIPRVEFLNVNSQANQVRYQYASAEGDVGVSELVLKQTMSLEPEENIDVEPIPEVRAASTTVDFDRALRIALMNRPEIKISTLTVEYNKYEKRIARAKGWPKIDGMGSWGLAKELYIAEDNQPTWDATNGVWNYNPYRKLGPQWYWGIKASMPIGGSTFEYSVTRERWVPVVSAYHGTQATTNTMKLNLLDKVGYYSDIADAEVGYWRSEQELQKAVQDVTLEVKEGVYGLEKSKLQLATSESKVKYQAQDLELTKFKRGMDEVQDSVVVESMIKLGQEKFGYAQAVADYHIAIATLDKAMGIENYLSAEGDISKR